MPPYNSATLEGRQECEAAGVREVRLDRRMDSLFPVVLACGIIPRTRLQAIGKSR